MKFLIKCKEAQHICDKNQYKEAAFFEKVLLNIHLLFCKICRGYTCNNGKLTKAIKTSDIKTLRPEDKQILKERLSREINFN